MTEFKLIQRLSFEINQLRMLSCYLKGLAEHYESEYGYYQKKLENLENPLTIEPVVSMYRVCSDADFSADQLNAALGRLEEIRKQLAELSDDIMMDGIES